MIFLLGVSTLELFNGVYTQLEKRKRFEMGIRDVAYDYKIVAYLFSKL